MHFHCAFPLDCMAGGHTILTSRELMWC